jgi:hypothetical protein
VPQYRLPSANGMNPLLLRDTVEYRSSFSHLNDRQFVLDSTESPLFDLAGIRYIVTKRDDIPGTTAIYRGPDSIVFENPRAFPRFFLVGVVAGVDSALEAFQKIQARQVDPSRVVLVGKTNLPLFAALGGTAAPEDPGEVEILSYTPNEFRVRVTARLPAAFVAVETFTRDWFATLDGHPSPVVRADGLFRVTPVPEGSHEIRMFIRPRMLYIGATLSCCGLVLVLLCLSLPLTRGKRKSRGQETAG